MTDIRLRVLITGGASGIGFATAVAFDNLGANVAILDRANEGPDGFLYERADVTSSSAGESAVARLIDQLGGLDVLVNCAGIGAQGDIGANSDDEWHAVYDVNVVGMVRVTRAATAALVGSPSGAIVNVSSIAATVGLPERVLYSATKGAVLSMT